MTIRRWLLLVVASLLVVAHAPPPAFGSHELPEYSDRQIQDLIDFGFDQLPSLDHRSDEAPITGDGSLDARIWEIAYERGYELQPSALDPELVFDDGVRMQSLTSEAWQNLQTAAARAGHHIAITSAHRGLEEQRDLFTSRLDGTSDAEIDERLAVAAPPGASRHHSGYALDIREVGDTFGDFGATASYDWLAADNYRNAKRFGFVPSYPPSITDAGPDPEAWEWVYVGENVIFHDGPFHDVLPNHLFVTAIEWMATTEITHGCSSDGHYFCPDLTVDRGQMAAFLRRAFGFKFVDADYFVDDSDSIFEGDIDAIAEARVTRGCNPPTNTRYCPRHDVERGALAAFLSRAFDLPAADVDFFDDDEDSIFEDDINALATAGITKGCGERRYCPLQPVSRGEMAAMLYRASDLLSK